MLLEEAKAYYAAMAKPAKTDAGNFKAERAQLLNKIGRIKQMFEDGMAPYAAGKRRSGPARRACARSMQSFLLLIRS